ncbi:MAG TPA: hypothetical protein VK009_03660 [Chloroflexota bacterium]|nr:hypothetical protein [Chloroflexota bacterium]
MRALALGLLLSLAPLTATAHGDIVQLDTRAGPYEVQAFGNASSEIPGAVDLSIVVEDAVSGRPIDDARVEVAAHQAGSPALASHAQARLAHESGPAHYLATLHLPASGTWLADLHIEGPLGPAEASLSLAPPAVSIYSRLTNGLTWAAPILAAAWIAFRWLAARRRPAAQPAPA